MGALNKKRNRSIDSLWRGNVNLIKAVEAITGMVIGSDDGVMFIQNEGTKLSGRAYIDVNSGKMYKCITQTTSVNNDSNFSEMNIVSNQSQHETLDNYSRVLSKHLYSTHTGHFRLDKIGKLVVFTMDSSQYFKDMPNGPIDSLDIPYEFRPREAVYMNVKGSNSSTDTFIIFFIQSNGKIIKYADASQGTPMYGTISWYTRD